MKMYLFTHSATVHVHATIRLRHKHTQLHILIQYLLTLLARAENLSTWAVSLNTEALLLTFNIMATLPSRAYFPLPMKYACNNLVSLLSLKGTRVPSVFFLALWLCLMASIHLPSTSREVLMELASLHRSPLAPVFLLRSLPAKSTIENLKRNWHHYYQSKQHACDDMYSTVHVLNPVEKFCLQYPNSLFLFTCTCMNISVHFSKNIVEKKLR